VCPPALVSLALAALTAGPAGGVPWQVRAAAAQALAAAPPGIAVPPLSRAARDSHADVRKAAVIALAGMSGHPAVTDTLQAAAADSDADVRAYARRATQQAKPERPKAAAHE
jgi:HEAT repeat protein